MAISTIWTNFLNGDTGLAIRNALNTFNTNILADMVATEARVTQNETDITTLGGAKDKLQFTPQVTPPAHVEGQVYYNDAKEEFRLQGPFLGVEVPVGHGEHIHVINNSGSIITKGTPCRHDGVAAGEVQVVPAQANTFVNARIFGLAAEDIAIGARGAIVTSGEIDDMDTSTMTVGIPQYLSATIAGDFVETPPDIVSQAGGALTQDAITGRFYVQTINNTNLPTVFSGVKELVTPAVPLTTSPIDITNYVTKEEVVMLADLTTGELTVSNNGVYRASVTADVSFPSAITTRTIYVELYDVTNTTILFTYAKNIPRDATEDAFSFNYPFSSIADSKYKLRVRASTAFTVTANDVTFDIQSINIL